MPDQNNPNQGGPGGPARTGQPDPNLQAFTDAVAKGLPYFREMVTGMEQFVGLTDSARKAQEKLNKATRDWTSDLKGNLAFIDESEERLKAIADHQKLIAKTGMKAKDWKEVAHHLKHMEESSKNMAKEGIFSPKHARTASQYTRAIKDSLKEIEDSMEDAFDPSRVEKLFESLGRLNRRVAKNIQDMRKLQISGVGHDASAMEQAVSRFAGRNSTRIDKWHKYAQAGHEIRHAQRLRHQDRVEDFQARRGQVDKHLKSIGIDPTLSRRVGNYRFLNTGADDPVRAGLVQGARNTGLGRVGSRIFANHALAESNGGKPGFMNRVGMNLLMRGEGSMLRGVGSWGTGLVEGGAGSLMKMAGEAAPVLAGLEVVRELFDKNQKMNGEVASKLGNGGIFGGGNDAYKSLRNVRRNLTPNSNGGFYNNLGIGYEKNLEIAKAITDSGMSTRNLSDNIAGQDNGVLNNSFGTFQRNAYAFGRRAGLDPNQTTAQTIKLISVYGQSLKDTEDFFVRINRDSRAAGITASKYIEILDDANSAYDRQNKLLMTTVDTMRLLSRTGRETADNLKDAMDIRQNGGQGFSLETGAYLGMKTLQNPEQARRLMASRELNMDNATGALSSALGTNYDAATLKQGFASQGYGYISQLKSDADKMYGGDDVKHQAAINAINAFSQAGTRVNVLKSAMAKGGIEGGLGLSVSDKLMGNDMTSQTTNTLQGVLSALQLSGHSSKELMSLGGRANLMQDPALLKSLETLGINPEKAMRSMNFVDDIADARVKMAQQGMGAADKTELTDAQYQDKQQSLESMYQFVKANGGKLGPGNDHAAALKAYANTDEGEAMMHKLIPQMEGTLEDFFSSPILQRALKEKVTEADKNAALADTQKLVANTRPTAEVFADAFTALFNKLADPLNDIARVLTFKFDPDGKSWASEEQKKQIEALVNDGSVGKKLDAKQAEVDALQDKYDAETDPSKKAGIKSQLDAATADLDKNRDGLSTFQQGRGIGSNQAADMLNYFSGGDLATHDPKKFLEAIGVKLGPQNSAELDAPTLSHYGDQLRKMEALKEITITQDTTPYGGGGHTYITYNQSTVDLTQVAPQVKQAANNANEKAPNPAKPSPLRAQ
jgi:hypothetical protein